MEENKKRKCTKESGLYQYRFSGENLKFWKEMLGNTHYSTKLLLEILNTLQYYYKQDPRIIRTFFGTPFYERYFGHMDKIKGEKSK